MKTPLRIQFQGVDRSDALEAAARDYAQKLELFAPDIMSCRVDIDQQGRAFGVRIALNLPGQELAVNRVQNDDVYIALRDAFDSMRRQVEDVASRRRDQVKQQAPDQV